MKKMLLLCMVGSFVIAGVSMNKSITYGNLDGTVSVMSGMNVDFDLNDTMSIGYADALGLLVKTAGPASTEIRIGWNGTSSTLGVGYDWWTGGNSGITTTIGTALDYTSNGTTDDTKVSIVLGWGF